MNEEFKIEKGVPVQPGRKRGKWKDLLASMDVGDSVLLPGTKGKTCSVCSRYSGISVSARDFGYKITGRATPEGIRVWMVSKGESK